MANMTFDRDTLRALADEGNQTALDRLADLADARGDLDELNELLDEGSCRAGHLLTRRAVKVGDLLELQRLSDAGCDEAGSELGRLLAPRPAPTRTDSAHTWRSGEHEFAHADPGRCNPSRVRSMSRSMEDPNMSAWPRGWPTDARAAARLG